MTQADMLLELSRLKTAYLHELAALEQRLVDTNAATKRDRYSDHAAFNMSATCQNLAVLAGKIEQTANVVRWMGEAKS